MRSISSLIVASLMFFSVGASADVPLFRSMLKSAGGMNPPAANLPIDPGQPQLIRQARGTFRVFRTTITEVNGTFFFNRVKICEKQGLVPVYDSRQPSSGGYVVPANRVCTTQFQGRQLQIDVTARVDLGPGGEIFPGDLKSALAYSNMNMPAGGLLPPTPIGSMAASRDLNQRSFLLLMDADAGISCEGNPGAVTCSVRNPEFFTIAVEIED